MDPVREIKGSLECLIEILKYYGSNYSYSISPCNDGEFILHLSIRDKFGRLRLVRERRCFDGERLQSSKEK